MNKSCDNCIHGNRLYADGYILKNWTRYEGDTSKLPLPADQERFWTYLECTKNNKGLKFLNLDFKCPVHQVKR